MQREATLYTAGTLVKSGSPQSCFICLFCFYLDTSYSFLDSSNPITNCNFCWVIWKGSAWACSCTTPLPLYEAVVSSRLSGWHCTCHVPISVRTLWALWNSFYCLISLRVDLLVRPTKKGWMLLMMLNLSLGKYTSSLLNFQKTLIFFLLRFYQEVVHFV